MGNMDNRDIWISIIICVYNNKKYLPYAIESVLCQDISNYEIVIIDDGSNDGTENIVDDYSRKYSFIKGIHQKNQWIYASFNNGISNASGEYIFILNSDDRLADNSLKLLRSKIDQYNHPDVIWTQVQVNDYCEKNNSWKKRRSDSYIEKEQYISSNEELADLWIYMEKKGLITSQANLYRKEVIKGIYFDNRWIIGDRLFNIYIAKKVNKSLIICERIYEYMQYGNELMNAAEGKVYGYEAEMYDCLYSEYIELMSYWGKKEYIEYFYMERLRCVRRMINNIRKKVNDVNASSCIEYLLNKIITPRVEDYYEYIGYEEKEADQARLLSSLREIFQKYEIQENSKYYEIYLMLEAFCRYEKDDSDYEAIRNGVYSELNPFNIGKVFYEKLI